MRDITDTETIVNTTTILSQVWRYNESNLQQILVIYIVLHVMHTYIQTQLIIQNPWTLDITYVVEAH